ncbi:MAG TPA: M20/M25/M40 family metallo-hydrolase [Caulobacteraceae bacterium]|jgi:acetylornithine deacetylase/succinyl-diaminopimelate desuccinylase-like protein
MKSALLALAVAALAAQAPVSQASAAEPAPRPDQLTFRDLYKELIETDTSYAGRGCTLASQRMAARLKAAGYAEADLNLFADPAYPKEGGLIATLRGSDPKAKAIMLLAHIDVVEAKRSDWQRDPFKLIEENGYFYARGATDDKAMAAVWVDSLVRYRQQGYRPRRSIRMVLTCGEEASPGLKGAWWLVNQHPEWLDAAMGLNEGVGGDLDAKGNRLSLGIESGEKTYQDFQLTAEGAGGHAARPDGHNVLFNMSAALLELKDLEFPVQFNDATRIYFGRTAKILGGETGAAMTALLANPKDAKADAIVSRNPIWHSMLRTTCVPTMFDAGHLKNAVPEHAESNVNCRIFPGVPVEVVETAIRTAINDPQVKVTRVISVHPSKVAPPPPLNDTILGPAEKVANRIWPGVPVIPTLSTGATDARYFTSIGIPTYGLSGMFRDPDGDGVHGLNERIRVRSLYEGRDFLFDVVKLYADSPKLGNGQ